MQFDVSIAAETLAKIKPNATDDGAAAAPQVVAHLDLRLLPYARCLFFGRAGTGVATAALEIARRKNLPFFDLDETKDANAFNEIIETDSGVVVALRGEDVNAIDARLKEIGVDPAKARFSLIIETTGPCSAVHY